MKLPENCITKILSFTSPQDAFRLSLTMGSTFGSAAESDAVWEAFMPSDYTDIISRSLEFSPPPLTFSIKDLFFHLAHTPLIIDHGTKSFSLEKSSGRKCYMLGARDLNIVWSNDPEYWIFKSLPESRFPEVAELLLVCWLEINGKLSTNLLSRNTLYGAYLVFKVTSQVIGIDSHPMEVSCGISGSDTAYKTHTVFLDHRRRRKNGSRNKMKNLPKARGDGWLEIKIGEYLKLDDDEEDDGHDLEMSFKGVKERHWKAGLIIEGIEIRPERNK
ncbi:putative F-box protein PP2-B12 [Impatiens glandulifera]|uniref:putative F-box protein PP2-B12 n=1 Tax=Impatiens glandulifera TaxID=253017 RepID=UPI001FB11BD8|nr:putative F-box protein PP2-B12 [Impatiens glandulifera]